MSGACESGCRGISSAVLAMPTPLAMGYERTGGSARQMAAIAEVFTGQYGRGLYRCVRVQMRVVLCGMCTRLLPAPIAARFPVASWPCAQRLSRGIVRLKYNISQVWRGVIR